MVGNLSVVNPTVEQMNQAITTPQQTGVVSSSDTAFGEHLGEAVEAVRRVFK
jgi:hypothetical protein